MGSKGSNTVTTNSTPNPQAMAAYTGALKDAKSAYNWGLQYNPVNYNGELVAGVNPQQYQGISGINQYANAAQPAIGTAQNWITQAAQPITGQQIQQYMNPFTNQVVNATEADFANMNAQQRQGVVGNAIAQGAFGGNREAIAEAELAHQQASAQDPIIAKLRSQGYQTGVNTALTEQQNRANQAYGLANVAGSGQNLGLTGANAMIGAGGLEQGTQQALDTALWNKYMLTGAYPMQLASANAGIASGIGSQMGGTSTTTGPPPSIFSQIAGLGTASLGMFGSTGAVPYMFGNRGGAVKGYDSGGFVDADPYMPTVNITHGPGPPKPPSAPSQQAQSPLQGLGTLGTALGGKGGLVPALGSAFSSGITSLGEAMPEVGAALADAAPFVGLALNRGGDVHRYDDGGVVTPNPDPTGMLPYSKPQGIYPLQYPSFKSNIPNVNISHGSGIPKPPSIQGQSQNDLNNQAKQIGSLTKAIMGDRSQSAQDAAQDAEQDATEDARRGGGIRGYAEGGAPPDMYYDPLASQSGVVRVPTEIGIHDDIDRNSTDNGIIGYNPDFSFSNLPASDPAGIKSDASIKYRENPIHQPSISLADKLAGEPGRTDDIPAELPPLPAPKTIPSKFRDDPEDYARARSPFSQLTAYADEHRRPVAEQPQARGLSGMFSGVDLSANSKLWPALMAAGFGMMASRSPFAGVGIGEGGQQGVKTYNELSEQEKRHNLTQKEIDQKSEALAQRAEQLARREKLESQKLFLESQKPVRVHRTSEGEEIMGIRNPLGGYLDPITGKPLDLRSYGVNNSQENLQPSTPAYALPVDYQERVKALPADLRGPDPIRNEDYLNNIKPEEADTVRGLVNYQLNPASLSTKGGHRERLLGMAMRYDPTYDQTLYPAKQRGVTEFYAGGPQSPAGIMTNGNTALLHLRDMSDALEEFKGEAGKSWNPAAVVGGWGVPFLSHWANQAYNSSLAGTGDSAAVALTKFNQAKQRFTEEVTKFYAGGQGTQAEREHALTILDSAKSLPELRAAIAEDSRLMKDKVSQMQNRLMQNMGPLAWRNALIRDPEGVLIYKNSRDALKTIESREKGENVPSKSTHSPEETSQILNQARAAISSGKSRQGVIDKLKSMGIDPSGL